MERNVFKCESVQVLMSMVGLECGVIAIQYAKYNIFKCELL